MNLDGPWLAKEDDDPSVKAFNPLADGPEWHQVEIPSLWAHCPPLQGASGPVTYRKQFQWPAPSGLQRVQLCFDGVIGPASVWFNDQYLGRVKPYFQTSMFELTDLLNANNEDQHVVAVRVEQAEQVNQRGKQAFVGNLQSSSLSAPGPQAGIWRPVRLTETGPIAITTARLLCIKATSKEAKLQFRLGLDALEACDIQLDISIVSPTGQSAGGGVQHFQLKAGHNNINWTNEINEPQLWWPAELGPQPLYDVAVAVRTREPTVRSDPGQELSEVSDRTHWRTGLRTVEVNDLRWKINGKRLFVKGVVFGPAPLASPQAGDQITDDIQSALAAGFNLLRVQGHVSHPKLYTEADKHGLLVWQDAPLVGDYSAAVRSRAEGLGAAMVDNLGHHPSISVWCAHDEPNGSPLPEPAGVVDPLGGLGRHVGRHLLPSWTRSVLGPLVRRSLRQADTSRSVITRSGSLPHLTDRDPSDAHLWLGWHSGQVSDLTKIFRRWPRLATFLGGIGTQSVNVKNWGADEPSWPNAQRGAFNRYMPRAAYASGELWAHASRLYQADVVRQHIETIRKLKYRPAGGFCVTAVADSAPEGGFGLLDFYRQPKPAYESAADVCRPVIVVADRPPAAVVPGQRFSLGVHAISDLRIPLENVTIQVRASMENWETVRSWNGSIAEDSCAFVADVDLEVPHSYGRLTIDIDLHHEQVVATNRYTTAVIPRVEANLD